MLERVSGGVPPVGIEPTLTVPETDALSTELRGLGRSRLTSPGRVTTVAARGACRSDPSDETDHDDPESSHRTAPTPGN